MASRCFRFSGHQTFAFRYGWPEKGYDFVIHGNHFSDPDAMITLGVGKNMVESIKYWCEMLGIISEYGKVTAFAQKLLDRENGWDPYLEDNASLWLLHWRFCTQTQWMSAATFLFGETFKNAISYKEFNNLLEKKLSSIGDSQKKRTPSSNIITRDIDCCIRMYTPPRNDVKNPILELSYGCPFQELGLCSVSYQENVIRFAIGPKQDLPPEIIGYAIWDYLSRDRRQASSLGELTFSPYSPGSVFVLDENSLVDALESLQQHSRLHNYFSLTASEGIETVHCTLRDGNELLNSYYSTTE